MGVENRFSSRELEQPINPHRQFMLGLKQFSQIIESIPKNPPPLGYSIDDPGVYYEKQNANCNGKIYLWPPNLKKKNGTIPRCGVMTIKYSSGSNRFYPTESTIIWKSPLDYKYILKSKLNSLATFIHGFFQETNQDNLRFEESLITDLSGKIYPETFTQLNPQELNSISFNTFNQQHKNAFPQYVSWSENLAQFVKYWHIEQHL